MKMVSFRVRNFDKEQFLTYDIDNEAELDEDVLDFLEDEEPNGIVPVIFEDDDEEFDTFSYDITDKIHLSELSNQEINAEMVLMVLRGIVIALADMAEYRIPLSYLVLNRDYIYIDSDYKVEFICIPLEEMQEDANVNLFLRNFIASLRFDVTEDVSYVARLLTYINNTAIFNLRNLLTMVEELMEDHGIEIPEDNSSEIYADYQEVEEKSAVDLVEELDEVDDLEEQAEEEVSDDAQAAEEDIPKEEEPEEEEIVQPEEEKVSDEKEPQKSDLNSKFSIKEPAEDDEEYEEEPEDDEPKKSNLSSKFSLKEPEPDEEETAVTEEETAEETVIQPDEDVEEPEEQSEETVDEEEVAEETEEETVGEETEEETEEELPEDNQIQEEEMSEEIATQVEEETQEEELPVEDELQEDEPPVDEVVQETVEEEIPEEAIEEDVKEETVVDSTAQDIVNKLKNKVIGGKKKTNTSENEESDEGEEDKKKPVFKTKEITGVVIPDELDEFLAEKEREEQENKETRHEETSLKIKKNIKVNRASIVKNTQEELKEGEPEKEETEAASAKTDALEETKNDDGEAAADTGAEQNGGKAGILKSAPAPKVNPYLVRVNTEERIMITKQTFKMGKASMGVDYTVKGNGAVSRVHAIITNKDGEYFVKDNKSTNHTYVNGKILNDGDNEPLTHDSKIMLGDEEFIFKLQ